MLIIIIELLVVLLALYLGSKYGSLALGAIAGLGLAILVFDHGLKPGTPPTDVIYIIVAAVTCAGVLQASGGMDWMIQIVERILRKHPQHITFLAPLSTFFLTVVCGTGHVMYTLMPIVTDVAIKKGIRPERPLAVASVASMLAIVCSPISAPGHTTAVWTSIRILSSLKKSKTPFNMHSYTATQLRRSTSRLTRSLSGLSISSWPPSF